MNTLIIDHLKQGEELLQKIDYDPRQVKTKNRREIELENGNRIKIRAPTNSIRGHKPNLVIVKCDVDKEYYDTMIKPCIGSHGMIIDESERT